jgi:predicted Zn-dependent peptidase
MQELPVDESIQWCQLDSGLKVVSVEMPSFYTISAGLFACVGSRYESPEEEGLSHMIEHMLFKGSARYSAYEITATVEGGGGSLNAYTAEESTCIHLKTFPSHFPQMMDVLLDMYTEPRFDSAELEKEKEVIIEEIRSYEDQPSAYIGDLFSKVIWDGHPLGNYILGKEEALQRFTSDDVQRFFEKHYVAENTVLAVAGHITHAQVLEWAKRHEKRFRTGPSTSYSPYRQQQERSRIEVVNWETEQCQLQFGVPCCDRYSPEQWPLRLLSTILGENMSSRLFQEIREKRALAYHVSSGYDLYEDTGCFFVQGAVEQDKMQDYLAASLNVLGSLQRQPVTAIELDHAKSYAIGQAMQDLESTMSGMLWVGEKMLGSDREFTTRYFCEQIQKVTIEDVQKLAEKLFQSSKLNLAVVGPVTAGEALDNLLCF